MKLNLGCGENPLKGYVNLDIRKTKGVDVIGDARKTGFPDNTFEEIVISHLLEHFCDRDVYRVLNEVHRIGKKNAKVKIFVPYFKSAYSAISVQHKTFYSWHTPETTILELEREKGKKFSITKKEYYMLGNFPGSKLIKIIANPFPRFYEKFLSGILTVDCLFWEMKIIKK